MKKDREIIKEFFEKHAKKFGDTVHSLAWESDLTQEIRFKILAEIHDLSGYKILDVGCGKADLYSYLIKNGINTTYYGVDLTRRLIELGKENHPEVDLFYRDFLKDDFYPDVDFCVSSGIANVLTPNNKEYIEKIIMKMFSICKKGTAVNMLSSYAYDSEAGNNFGMYFYSPEEMFRFAKKLTTHVIIRHDYLENDFTLYLYKRDDV